MTATTRDRILDAALRAFASRGVEATPITDLEAAAGLAAGSGGFYRYFKTKDEVLVAVVRREMDRAEAEHATALAELAPASAEAPEASGDPAAAEAEHATALAELAPASAEAPDASGDPAAAVRARLETGLELLGRLGPLMAILAREHGRIPELAAEVSERMIVGGLRQDAAQLAPLLGGSAGDDAHEVGAVILSALVGYTLASRYFGAPPGGVGPERFAATLADLATTPLPDKERSL